MSSVGDGVFTLWMRTRFMIRKRIHGRVSSAAGPRGGIGVAAVNGELYVFGGETLFPNGGGEVHGEVEVFSPATNTWRSLSPMPTRVMVSGRR